MERIVRRSKLTQKGADEIASKIDRVFFEELDRK
jgi:hypothetical protein